MNILITGINGFVGRALSATLLAEGNNVYGLSRTLCVNKGNLVVHQGDIRNINLLRELVSMYEIDTVYHLAACAIVRSSAKDPLTCYDVNVNGTIAILEAVRQVDPSIRLVVASSDKAYGDAEAPYTERTALRPTNTYDASKAAGDLISQAYLNNYGMNVCITRACNIYGPQDPNPSRLIPQTVLRCLDGEAPYVYADAFSMVREFVYIDDVVEAYIRLGDMDHRGPVNIGTSDHFTVASAVERICAVAHMLGLDHQSYDVLERTDERFKEIQVQKTDTRLITSLGWVARTHFAQGIEKIFRHELKL